LLKHLFGARYEFSYEHENRLARIKGKVAWYHIAALVILEWEALKTGGRGW